jgi:hypothetical protein
MSDILLQLKVWGGGHPGLLVEPFLHGILKYKFMITDGTDIPKE